MTAQIEHLSGVAESYRQREQQAQTTAQALFVDTSAFYAIADEDERPRREALSALQASGGSERVITSNHLVVESRLPICSRLGRNAAVRLWDGVSIDVLTVVGVTAEDLRRARNVAQEWSDQAFSLLDCTSFALIERLDLRRASAFDRHCRIVGFGSRCHRA